MYPSCSDVFATIFSTKSSPVSSTKVARVFSMRSDGKVARTSMRAASSSRQSRTRWATFPRASPWLKKASGIAPPSAHAAKFSRVAPPICSGSHAAITSSNDTPSTPSLTCDKKYPISDRVTIAFPVRSNAWNCICLATSVDLSSRILFFLHMTCWGGPRFHRRASSGVSSHPVSASITQESQDSRNTMSLWRKRAGREVFPSSNSCCSLPLPVGRSGSIVTLLKSSLAVK
mmetsp:Transcript_50729/g.115328  ORF Transcript_50729/g.115328 Transcript_50729/m.115328 type:complete len:231 (+) Transcript_50729:3248-3940(+)